MINLKITKKEKCEDGKHCHSGSVDPLDGWEQMSAAHQTKLEEVICQRIPTDFSVLPSNVIVLEQLEPLPSAAVLLQLRSELLLDE